MMTTQKWTIVVISRENGLQSLTLEGNVQRLAGVREQVKDGCRDVGLSCFVFSVNHTPVQEP